ncbi:MAG: M13 family metallopeptidase [Pseudomonadota bacterium]
MSTAPIPVTVTVVASLLAFSCGGQAQQAAKSPSVLQPSQQNQQDQVFGADTVLEVQRARQATMTEVGLDLAAVDRGVDPCQDFYQFACGGWLAQTQIPPDRPRWHRSFDDIERRNEQALRAILEEAAAASGAGGQSGGGTDTSRRQAAMGDFYAACMDESAINKAGTAPIDKLLARARQVRDLPSLAAVIADLHMVGIEPFFRLDVEFDPTDSKRIIAHLDQGGLGLPDRVHYSQAGSNADRIRKAYLGHVTKMMRLSALSQPDAVQAANDVLAIETDLAKVSKTRADLRDPRGACNKRDRPSLAKASPSFAWDAYFRQLGYPGIQDVNIDSVQFFEGLSKLLETTKPATWRSYLRWHVLRSTASLLSSAFQDEELALRTALTGETNKPERSRQCIWATDRALGHILSQEYVARHFSTDGQTQVRQLVAVISDTFASHLQTLKWMDDTTRERALAKLEQITSLVGFPVKWRGYDFPIDRGAYAANVLAARKFDSKWELDKIGKPFDPEEWKMSPLKANAYYDMSRNHIAIPAGVLQPPLFSPSASLVVNMGGIGMVIAHEITHGFDDHGAQFSGEGNLENWWDPQTASQFRERLQCLSRQFSRFESTPGVSLNSDLSIGENVADLGGATLAFEAYRTVRQTAEEVIVADDFTEDQQFFLALGQSWCAALRDEYLHTLNKVDPHSPPKFRINGTVANMPEFAEAFSCAEGTPMHPVNTCQVW